MKKLCLILCCVMLLQALCGCKGSKEEVQTPVNFYYRNTEITYNSPISVIHPEVREGVAFHGNLTAMLRSYFLGPMDSNLEQVIPSDIYMVSCEHYGDVVSIVMSSQFSKLSGMELSVACGALLLTVHDFTGAETLKIGVKDAKVDDQDELVLSISDFELIDTVK